MKDDTYALVGGSLFAVGIAVMAALAYLSQDEANCLHHWQGLAVRWSWHSGCLVDPHADQHWIRVPSNPKQVTP